MSKCNLQSTELFINTLITNQVDYFCIAPGSRSTPLVLAIANTKNSSTFSHCDERSLCFHALGVAKAKKKPVVVVTTSGSACGNLLPAIMEAHADNIPLIIITADRPQELHNCGSNQTIDQSKIFQNFVRWQLSLHSQESQAENDSFYLESATLAASKALSGPVHINWSFSEPFFDDSYKPRKTQNLFPFKIEIAKATTPEAVLKDTIELLKKPTIILFGSEDSSILENDYSLFFSKIHHPVVADILSNSRHHIPKGQLLKNHDLFFSNLNGLPPNLNILHLGRSLISKNAMTLIAKTKPQRYIQVSESDIEDPYRVVTDKVFISSSQFLKDLSPLLLDQIFETSLESLKVTSESFRQVVDNLLNEDETFCEAKIASTLSKILPPFPVFLGNSMCTRNADIFFDPHLPTKYFGNRGVSGIDGNLSTAFGISQGLKKTCITIVGDQTFIHDLNALYQLPTLQEPQLIIVINNQGNDIFHLLPISKQKEPFNKYFLCNHSFNFRKIDAIAPLNSYSVESVSELKSLITRWKESPSHTLIECRVKTGNNLDFRNKVKNALQFKPLETHVLCQLQ